MFDLHFNAKGEKILVYSKRDRYLGERGIWIDIGHERDKEINFYIEFNRKNGLEVVKDEKGTWRALVLKD